MPKNVEYETNVLDNFVTLYSRQENKEFSLGERRNVREDSILISKDGKQIFSLELTKITNSKIEKLTAFLIKKTGVGRPFTSYGTREAISAIIRKENLYSDYEDRYLILDAFSSVPFAWFEYWKPVIQYGNKTRFTGIYAIGMSSGKCEILRIK